MGPEFLQTRRRAEETADEFGVDAMAVAAMLADRGWHGLACRGEQRRIIDEGSEKPVHRSG
jgi:hypothetical protein